MEFISVLVADSQPLMRMGMKCLLGKTDDIIVTSEAKNSKELEDSLFQMTPDVVFIDFTLDEFQMDDLLTIKKLAPQAGIIGISANPSKTQVHKSLEHGTTCMLLKECDENEITAAVRAASKGEKFFCGKILDLILEEPKKVNSPTCDPAKLSTRETEIVKLIASGMTTNQIANKLFLSVHTINTHRKNIMRKLEVNSATEIVLFAINSSII